MVVFSHPPDATQWLTVGEAAKLTEGMRMTALRGTPGVAPLIVQHCLYAKKIPVAYVTHPFGPEMGVKDPGPANELYSLTAQRSVPVMWWADERPRSAWHEQL